MKPPRFWVIRNATGVGPETQTDKQTGVGYEEDLNTSEQVVAFFMGRNASYYSVYARLEGIPTELSSMEHFLASVFKP